jgi:hypothetical protein
MRFFVIEDEAAGNQFDIFPRESRIRIFCGDIRRRKHEREGISPGHSFNPPVTQGKEWRFKLWRRAGNPENAVRRIAHFQELAQVFDGGVIDTETGANALPESWFALFESGNIWKYVIALRVSILFSLSAHIFSNLKSIQKHFVLRPWSGKVLFNWN